MTQPPSPFSFALVGAGRVGTAVASLLRSAGHVCAGVTSRDPKSAERSAALLSAPAFDMSGLPPADVTLIGVVDRALDPVAGALASGGHETSVAIHFAGAAGIAPLEPLIKMGAWACALHPVQACPDVATAVERLPGSAWGVTCTWPATAWAHDLVSGALGGIPVDVTEEARPTWHAAAVSTSNGIAALLAAGERMLDAIGVARPHDVLGPLALGTVRNAMEGGGGAATLTGPAIRGDVATVDKHLHALASDAPGTLVAYRLAARLILEAGRVDPATTTRIVASLDDDR